MTSEPREEIRSEQGLSDDASQGIQLSDEPVCIRLVRDADGRLRVQARPASEVPPGQRAKVVRFDPPDDFYPLGVLRPGTSPLVRLGEDGGELHAVPDEEGKA